MRSPLSHESPAVHAGATSIARARTAARPLVVGISHPAFGAVGGAEVLLSAYARHLKACGHRIRLVTSSIDAGQWGDLTELADVRVLGNSWMDHVGIPGSHPKVWRRIKRHAEALEGVDVVLGGNFPGNVIAGSVADGARSMWVCMEPCRRLYPAATMPTLTARLQATPPAQDSALLHSLRKLIARDRAGRRDSANAAQRACDQQLVPRIAVVTAISHYSAANLSRIYSRAVDDVIYPTIALPDLARRVPGISSDGLRVLVHGRLDLIKNVETVVKGFAIFSRKHPGANELNIVGTGPDLLRLHGVARDAGIAHLVRFHGFLSPTALSAVYARCDVMAALPIDEPFGMVYPEAALRGLLLVGPDHGGPAEILAGGECGYPCDAFSAEHLASVFDELRSLNIGETERRRERAHFVCAQRFGPDATLPAIERTVTALALR